VRAATHGGDVGARLDFSTCVNAYGPAPVVLEAIRAADVAAYPDPRSGAARRAAANAWDRPVEEIAFGAGTAELIAAAVAAFVRPGDTVLVPRPAFGEYGRAALLAGGRVRRPARLPIDASGAAVALAMAVAVYAERPRVAFLAAPTSPAGTALSRDEVRAVADACAAVGGILVLDQAYDGCCAVPLGTPALAGDPAVLHLRSMTKDHALAGLRVGFAIGPAAMIAALDGVRVPWAASSVAQAAAVAALSDAAAVHVRETTSRLRAEARALAEWCGGRAVRSDTHYLLLRGVRTTGAGIAVRDCRSFGLPTYIRVAARTPPENTALRAVLRTYDV
jgi:histidinol-phosphate/aromatic aminotransferase/cobyric acid decarboxylase-like protein